MNSNWLRGYGDPPPQPVIAVGFTRDELGHMFASCAWAASLPRPYGIVNETIACGFSVALRSVATKVVAGAELRLNVTRWHVLNFAFPVRMFAFEIPNCAQERTPQGTECRVLFPGPTVLLHE
jgi:hypothetical protein